VLTGQCHCGNISFSVPEKPDTLTECNCSMCHRYGSRWAYYKPADVTVTVKTTPTETYQWGDKMIDFHHCSNCGCLTHYTSTDPSSDRLAINTRMCSLEDTKDIPIRLFDGADTWKFLN
jgi:hypothetical protein